MVPSNLSTICISFYIFFSILHTPTSCTQTQYIVYMGGHSHGPEITKKDLDKVSESHIDLLAKYLGSKEKANEALLMSYRRHINGFSANLDENVVEELKNDPNVISVFKNKEYKLQTTQSWEYLGFEKGNIISSNSLWKKAKFGEDIIIGNLDTGVWPESKSFSDEGYGPVPSRWRGICQKGTDPKFFCNRKLIGARFYQRGHEAVNGKMGGGLLSPRDDDGHGTHTLSTAGGNFVTGIEIPGVGKVGTAKGGAPRARVVAYKVCWPGCNTMDAFKAFDHAIYEGVDVLSLSLGGSDTPQPYDQDAFSLGAMHAIKYNLISVIAAGNTGPTPSSVLSVAPWSLNIGASTIPRHFESVVELGNGSGFKGVSIFDHAMPQDKQYQLVSGEQAQLPNSISPELGSRCQTPMDPVKVKGKILVCKENATESIVAAGTYGLQAGAVGMIFCNSEATGAHLVADYSFLPTSILNHKDGLTLLGYVKSTTNPTGVIKPPTLQLGIKPAPMTAMFSSRGPNAITPEILKPDVMAPGVDIVAAYSLEASPTVLPKDLDTRRFPYVTLSGTSMATPHVAGVVALLRAIYPKWSPSAIMSAIMTTATPFDSTGGPILDQSLADATPFGYGAGLIQPDQAADPGLVYTLHMKDYLNFLCVCGHSSSIIAFYYQKEYKCPEYSDEISHVNLNYPSITVPKLQKTVTVKRTVTNVGPAGTYKAQVTEPLGISVSVQPDTLEFKKSKEQKSFQLTLTAKEGGDVVPGRYVFGSLVWTDGTRKVRSPITVATA